MVVFELAVVLLAVFAVAVVDVLQQACAVAAVFVLVVVAAVEVVQPVAVVVVELKVMDEVDLESFVLVGFFVVDAVVLILELGL